MLKICKIIILLFISVTAQGREQIRIVGSSTLYPFITIAAEKFGKNSGHTPVVEATGTGGGFHLFCSGNSLHYPDIVNASRKIKPSEERLCKKNNVNNLQEILIGYDAVIMAQGKEGLDLKLTQEELFLALAKKIPHNGKIIPNFYQTWQEINPSLPNSKIEVYGPSFTSGTRDSFVELVMNGFCKSSAKMNQLIPDKKELLAACSVIREDGAYIEMPENDNLIIHKLLHNKFALGIVSFSLLAENSKIKALPLNDIIPSKNSIITGEYLISRPLFIYVNKDHLKALPSLNGFVT